MTPTLNQLRETERWIAWVRLAAVPFAIVEVGLLSTDYPSGYESWAWATTGLLAVAGVAFHLLSRSSVFVRAPRLFGLLGLVVDTVIVAAFVLLYQYEIGSPVNQLFFVLLVEAAVRYGIRWRSRRCSPSQNGGGSRGSTIRPTATSPTTSSSRGAC